MSNFVLKTCPVIVCSLAICLLSHALSDNDSAHEPHVRRTKTTGPADNSTRRVLRDGYLVTKEQRNNISILALVDDGYVELARNVFETPFRRHTIDNYVWTCKRMTKMRLIQTLLCDNKNNVIYNV